jgi:D-alanyl-D-alanine carboxypeptidase
MKTTIGFVALFVFGVAFSVVGCASSEADSSVANDLSSLEARDESACAALRTQMDGVVAQVPTAAYDAALEFETWDCGASFHTSGPSHLEPHRLFRVGSMTKTYVAIVTLGLVGEGKLALDQPLSAYLPDAPAAVLPITLRQLLQHTSGIYNYTDTDAFWAAYQANPMRKWQPSELVDLALTQPAYSVPGAEWHYSNTNFVLLGMMLEHLTATPIAKLIRDRILTPNGLHETFLDGAEPVVGQLSPGFDQDGHEIGSSYDASLAWTAGAMVASAADEARFVALVGTGALLPPALQLELTRGVDTPESGLQYGLGVFLFGAAITGGVGPGIGHGGDIMGFHTLGAYFPSKQMTLFGVVDSDSGNGNDVLAGVLKSLANSASAPSDPKHVDSGASAAVTMGPRDRRNGLSL